MTPERTKYRLAADRVSDGRWTVDPETGRVLGCQGVPIGSLDGEGFARLTIAEGTRIRCVQRSRVIWEAAHKEPVPEGFEIGHRDGCRQNDAVDNLVLLPANRYRR